MKIANVSHYRNAIIYTLKFLSTILIEIFPWQLFEINMCKFILKLSMLKSIKRKMIVLRKTWVEWNTLFYKCIRMVNRSEKDK